jgi:hypothetical protein
VSEQNAHAFIDGLELARKANLENEEKLTA